MSGESLSEAIVRCKKYVDAMQAENVQLKARLDAALELLFLAREAMCDDCAAGPEREKCDCELNTKIEAVLKQGRARVREGEADA
jgi:hypothetical protein